MSYRKPLGPVSSFNPITGGDEPDSNHLPSITGANRKHAPGHSNKHAEIFGILDEPTKRFQATNPMSQYKQNGDTGKWGDDLVQLKLATRLPNPAQRATEPEPTPSAPVVTYEYIVKSEPRAPGSFTFGTWNGSSTGAAVPVSSTDDSLTVNLFFTNAAGLPKGPTRVTFRNKFKDQQLGDPISVRFEPEVTIATVEHGSRLMVTSAPNNGFGKVPAPAASKAKKKAPPAPTGPVKVKSIKQL